VAPIGGTPSPRATRRKKIEKLGDPSLNRFYPWLSNDDIRLAFNMPSPQGGQQDIWVRDLARAINTSVTFHADAEIVLNSEFNSFACDWSPDGRFLCSTS
jgi:hypothetical protein